MTYSVPPALAKNAQASAAWLILLPFLAEFADVSVREKSTCLHIDAGGAAFLGVHPRKTGVRLTIVLDHGIDSDRIVKCEAVSKNRYHNELDFQSGDSVDTDLKAWIEAAYKLRLFKAMS
jgi:hypothetical protein